LNRNNLNGLKTERDFRQFFDCVGIKKITKTDISKDAYVVNNKQQRVLKKAGEHIDPAMEAQTKSITINFIYGPPLAKYFLMAFHNLTNFIIWV